MLCHHDLGVADREEGTANWESWVLDTETRGTGAEIVPLEKNAALTA